MRHLVCSALLAAGLFVGAVLPMHAQEVSSSAVYPIQEGYVDAHGVMIYYTTMGKGSPLLIVHGGPGASHDYFLPSLLPLARRHKLVFIDERGSGRSEKLEDAKQYTVEANVEDIEAVRMALGLGKIDLLGHSVGGVLVEAYALKYQQHLSHLVLASTFASAEAMNRRLQEIRDHMPEDKRARLDALEKAGLFGKGEAWEHGRYSVEYAQLAWGYGYFPYLYGARPDPNFDPTGLLNSSWDVYREMWGSHGEFVIDGNLKSVEYAGKLPAIKVPTLVICGDHDQIGPELAKQIQAGIMGSKLVLVPDAGHFTFVDQPVLWNKAVADFLDAK